jgi:NADP-dependent aldehyde dehydrogenase
MSSINPVIFLPGALAEDGAKLAHEITDSCLAGAGQFCTSPNLIIAFAGPDADRLLLTIAQNFNERAPQPLLSSAGRDQIGKGVAVLMAAGAHLITGGLPSEGLAFRFHNTLLHVTGEHFLTHPHQLQREVFGNATMVVTVLDTAELEAILAHLEGNLTGSVYSAKSGADDEVYNIIEPTLRQKVGRLLNDRMPTGVAVSPAMNHGGPFPATSHPGFTSVGIPASIPRFAALQCYDGVREDRLPPILRNTIHNPRTWRSIDGAFVNG